MVLNYDIPSNIEIEEEEESGESSDEEMKESDS